MPVLTRYQITWLNFPKDVSVSGKYLSTFCIHVHCTKSESILVGFSELPYCMVNLNCRLLYHLVKP